jgi:hypothetical protein
MLPDLIEELLETGPQALEEISRKKEMESARQRITEALRRLRVQYAPGMEDFDPNTYPDPALMKLYEMYGRELGLDPEDPKLASKTASRPLLSDFMAGIDPTGRQTFQYGIEDTEDNRFTNHLRRGAGVFGGFLAGSLLLPSLIYGVLNAAKGGMGGTGVLDRARAALTGFGKGFKLPFSTLNHGFKAKKYMQDIHGGVSPSGPGGEESLKHLLASRIGDLSPELVSRLRSANITPWLQDMARHDPQRFAMLGNRLNERLQRMLAVMGMGGLINAGSALVQYNLGQQMGGRVSPRDRERLLGRRA